MIMSSYKLSYTAEQIDELLKKLDSGVFLPVVELSTVGTAEGATLTAEETEQLKNALELGNFALVVLPIDVSVEPVVVRSVIEDGIKYFIGRTVMLKDDQSYAYHDIALMFSEGIGTVIIYLS